MVKKLVQALLFTCNIMSALLGSEFIKNFESKTKTAFKKLEIQYPPNIEYSTKYCFDGKANSDRICLQIPSFYLKKKLIQN